MRTVKMGKKNYLCSSRCSLRKHGDTFEWMLEYILFYFLILTSVCLRNLLTIEFPSIPFIHKIAKIASVLIVVIHPRDDVKVNAVCMAYCDTV